MCEVLSCMKLRDMKENEKVERLQVQFLKKALGVDRTTPNYILLQETNSYTVGVEAAARVARFECKVWGMNEGRIIGEVMRMARKEEK